MTKSQLYVILETIISITGCAPLHNITKSQHTHKNIQESLKFLFLQDFEQYKAYYLILIYILWVNF